MAKLSKMSRLSTDRNLKGVETAVSEDFVLLCEMCGKEFSCSQSLVAHTASNQHSRPFPCSLELCTRSFTQAAHLLNHRLVHPDPRLHQCPHCLMSFSKTSSLASHSSLGHCHPSPSPTLPSPGCSLIFSKPEHLRLHQNLRHHDHSSPPRPHSPERSTPPSSCCRSCGQVFGAPLEMLTHRLRCEKTSHWGVVCPGCCRTFKAARFLSHHLEVHRSCREASLDDEEEETAYVPAVKESPVSTYNCDWSECGKTFSKDVLLRNHMYTHTDFPFHCPACPDSFSLLASYRSHCLAAHGGREDLLSCVSCGDVFTVANHLETHRENIHKEVSYEVNVFEDEKHKPGSGEVTCPFCDNLYPSTSVLRVHLVSRHPPPWSCATCGAVLATLGLARGHAKLHGGQVAEKGRQSDMLECESIKQEVEELCEPADPVLEAERRQEAAHQLHLAILDRPGPPALGDFVRSFGISASSLQLREVPEVLEPGLLASSLTKGLAIDLLDLAQTRGLEQELVTFLPKFLPSHLRPEDTPEQHAEVVARLARVRLQATRFRTRYHQLPAYLDKYLLETFNPFT